jgi:hypothetical protein
MKILFLGDPLNFSVIPRIYPIISDTIILSLKNEMTGLEIIPGITFTIDDKLNISITTQPADFKTQNKYEISLKNGADLIYLGKMIILDSNTNIQNYEFNSQTSSRFDYKQ